MTLPADLDPECLKLCVALNDLDGVKTTESCCGHSKGPFRIWFHLDTSTWGHKVVSRCVCPRYYPSDWTISMGHNDVEPFTVFVLEGPADPSQGDVFAERIKETCAHPAVSRLFGISWRSPPRSGAEVKP